MVGLNKLGLIQAGKRYITLVNLNGTIEEIIKK